ncbi:hypothetical protein JYP49_14455 [Nitratireductor aquimarinus]|uniref:hypothetical protein n=1 Tax=Nitratireductor TaxID=245876 RepID=UPI0019D388DB|nr:MULTISPECIES: hypothetical protein [Nitratireductor]MBN7775742.1 hypothetical protein [Nitratireductor pacificus]MBN7781793.1 hypothetical protein [Nitratireductor pacificus]MBN7790599.1 hypothetical protein [Nitratireductor aquimarinus]MBY6098489.1 hypothetical protein [Nitratireductor aquimarinus]MCA1261980.1 hypothetical protein [Nitratireductor aquimarinus]
MPTDFASVHAHLENAQAELTGSDPATHQLREAIGLLLDAALKAEFSAKPEADNVVRFPRVAGARPGQNSRHG